MESFFSKSRRILKYIRNYYLDTIDQNLKGREKKEENSLILRMMVYYKIQKKSRVPWWKYHSR